MSRNITIKLTIVTILLLTKSFSNVYAQTDLSKIESDSIFTWKLLEVANPATQSTIQFIPRSDVTPVNWDFGDGNTSTNASPNNTFNYTAWDDSVTVNLSYTLNGESLSKSRKIPVSPAFFWIRNDSSLNNLATFKKIFNSNCRIENLSGSLGNLRFSWSIDGVALTGYTFTPSTLGQWPNIYYTFENGGAHQIKLEVYNTNTPANIAEYTHTINILPNFGATKEKLTNIPNIFTPNNDTNNDEFTVPTSGTGFFVFRVLSRSGGLLYQSKSSIIKWDGKNSQGNELPEGIYYYIIEDESGHYETATGFVYIYRGKK